MAKDAKSLRGHRRIRADVVIVGAGAGGGAAAAELAERGLSVVMLEEGHRYRPNEFPASYGWAINHIYAERGTRIVEGRSYYPLPGGRGVGGSTLINSAICYRAPDDILEKWAASGLENLSPERLAPIYARVEETIGVTKMHPLQARANNLFVKRGADALGLGGGFVHRNAPGCVGCGICYLGCPSGGKGSVDRNFIPMAEENGAEVCADCKVAEIVVRDGRAVGVVARVMDGDEEVGRLTVDADAVVLAAGTVGTPMLLLEHGLANASDQVGRNLAIHPAVGTYGMVDDAINSWDGVPQAYAIPLEKGVLLQTYNAPPEVFFTTQPWSGVDGMKKMRLMKNIAMCGGLVSDGSNGRVQPGRHGKAKVTYELADRDRHRLIRALRGIVRVLFAAGATEVYPGIGDGVDWAKTESEALAPLTPDVDERDMNVYASHPMGTCRMGINPRTSVVAPSGETHDVRGLWIADASLMPSSLGVNPQMTVMSMAIQVARNVARAA